MRSFWRGRAVIADPALFPDDMGVDYNRRAQACLAVVAKTNNRTSQAMLTAMAHTWLKLAEAGRVGYDGQADRYRQNAQEALQRSDGPDLALNRMWLRLADSWLQLLLSSPKSDLPEQQTNHQDRATHAS